MFFPSDIKIQKNQRNNQLKKLTGTYKLYIQAIYQAIYLYLSYTYKFMIPSFVINYKNSGYGTKPYKNRTLKSFLNWLIFLKAQTTMVIISSYFLVTASSFLIKLREERFCVGSHFEEL